MRATSLILTKFAAPICSRKNGGRIDPPTLNEVLRLIARVGGFLGRKGDGDPGVKTIWQGIQEVRVAALTIKALRDEGE